MNAVLAACAFQTHIGAYSADSEVGTKEPAPKVSVVIPTYKHRAFVLRNLDSVFKQTIQDVEVIVINDESPGDTRTVVAPLVASGRIQYFEQDNADEPDSKQRISTGAWRIYCFSRRR